MYVDMFLSRIGCNCRVLLAVNSKLNLRFEIRTYLGCNQGMYNFIISLVYVPVRSVFVCFCLFLYFIGTLFPVMCHPVDIHSFLLMYSIKSVYNTQLHHFI